MEFGQFSPKVPIGGNSILIDQKSTNLLIHTMFKKFSKVTSQFKNSFNYNKQNFKQEYQKFQKRRFTSSAKEDNSKTMAGLGFAGLIGGGFLLMNTLNKPIVETTADRQVVKSSITPYVQNYLFNTYKYVASGIAMTSLSAYFAYRSGLALRIFQINPIVSSLGFMAAIVGTSWWTRSIDSRDAVLKNVAFATFNTVMGLSLCGLCFYQPQILMRAGFYTAGVVSALSFTAMNAKEDRFLYIGGPLMAGLAVVALSGLATMFLPGQFVRTLSVLENLWLYGGLIVFSGLMLYDTQKLMHKAKVRNEITTYNPNANIPPPDFINESIGIYLNIINLFVRILQILQNQQRKR